MLEGIIAFVFGLVFGSFLNVVVLRFDDWASIVAHPSHCPHCKNRLKWYDLVPVLSYAMLRGKCRHCTKPISWQYPVVELSMAALTTAAYYKIFILVELPLWREIVCFALLILAISVMIIVFFHDLYEMMIPDILGFVLIGLALIYSLVYYQDVTGTIYAGLAGFLPIALLVYPSRGKWMGEGDVKLATGIGLLAGWPNAIAFLAVSFLAGGVFGAVAVAGKKAALKSAIPFAPFLIIGGLVALFWGDAIVGWYLGSIGYGYY